MPELETQALEEDSNEFEEEFEQEETELRAVESEETAELAPDSEPGHEQNTDDSNINQDKVNEVINKKHRLWKEAQEENDKLKQQLVELQQQQNQYQAPVIPPAPDPFDDDYDMKVKERDEAIARRVGFDLEQQQLDLQNQQMQQNAQLRQQQETAEKLQSYAKRAKDLGINDQDMGAAASQVGSYVSNEAATMILSDEQGPLISQYLSANPLELSKVAELSPLDSVLYIERNVKPKLNVKKRTTNATKPPGRADTTTSAVSNKKYPLTAGGKFY